MAYILSETELKIKSLGIEKVPPVLMITILGLRGKYNWIFVEHKSKGKGSARRHWKLHNNKSSWWGKEWPDKRLLAWFCNDVVDVIVAEEFWNILSFTCDKLKLFGSTPDRMWRVQGKSHQIFIRFPLKRHAHIKSSEQFIDFPIK